MPSLSKPTSYPQWTTGDPSQVAQPTPAQVASGFTAGERPTFQTINYQLWLINLWIQYCDSALSGTGITASIDPLLRLLGGGQWAWSAQSGTLSWSAPVTLQVPGLPDSQNTLAAGSVQLSDGQVAYFAANVPLNAQATVTSGSSTLTNVTNELGLAVGQQASGSGIPSGTTIAAISNGSVTLSEAATASGSNVLVTFCSTGPLTAQVTAVAQLAPSPNTVIFARCAMPRAIIGVNATLSVLRDGEAKLLGEQGFGSVVAATAGVALAAQQVVYLAPASGDGGRTAGAAYPAEAGVSAGVVRGNVLGVVAAPAASGAPVNVVASGTVSGLSGLTTGATYYLDPSNPGGMTSTRPQTIGQQVVALGQATSGSTLLLGTPGVGGQPVVSVNPWPQYGVAQQSDLVAAVGRCASAGGGVIVVTAPFQLAAQVTIPSGTVLVGRRGGAVISCMSGASLSLADTAQMRDVALVGAGAAALISVPGTACIVRGCALNLTASTSASGISVTGSSVRIYDCSFTGALGTGNVGIAYVSGSDNLDDSSVYF